MSKGVRVDVKANAGIRVEGVSNAQAPSDAFKVAEPEAGIKYKNNY